MLSDPEAFLRRFAPRRSSRPSASPPSSGPRARPPGRRAPPAEGVDAPENAGAVGLALAFELFRESVGDVHVGLAVLGAKELDEPAALARLAGGQLCQGSELGARGRLEQVVDELDGHEPRHGELGKALSIELGGPGDELGPAAIDPKMTPERLDHLRAAIAAPSACARWATRLRAGPEARSRRSSRARRRRANKRTRRSRTRLLCPTQALRVSPRSLLHGAAYRAAAAAASRSSMGPSGTQRRTNSAAAAPKRSAAMRDSASGIAVASASLANSAPR